MRSRSINSDNTVFVLLSFEGPDRYSQAGGLGVRVDGLSSTLANMGFPVHLIFIGDPSARGQEKRADGRLVLHRWCQWISRYHPKGVYDGENEKLHDFNKSVPGFVVDGLIRPAVASRKYVVILAEEWHTAEVMCRIGDLLRFNGLVDKVLTLWNANNTFGFDRIDWERLAHTTTITTVSKYMKHVMWNLGVNPLVIPNGIHASLLRKVDEAQVRRLRNSLKTDLLLSKVARWDPDKRWNTAVEAVARLRASGKRTVLLARGGIEPDGEQVIRKARSLGLTVKSSVAKGERFDDFLEAVEGADSCDVIDMRSHIPQSFLRVLYRASDAVLANSGREPFGIVGLETMAAGGVAFTGGTGEDYALHCYNSIVLETPDPQEIVMHLSRLEDNPEEAGKIRKAAQETARCFTWEEAVKNLITKLEYRGRTQGLFDTPKEASGARKPTSSWWPRTLGQESFEFPVPVAASAKGA